MYSYKCCCTTGAGLVVCQRFYWTSDSLYPTYHMWSRRRHTLTLSKSLSQCSVSLDLTLHVTKYSWSRSTGLPGRSWKRFDLQIFQFVFCCRHIHQCVFMSTELSKSLYILCIHKPFDGYFPNGVTSLNETQCHRRQESTRSSGLLGTCCQFLILSPAYKVLQRYYHFDLPVLLCTCS